MALSNTYYTELKVQLEAAAKAKKDAIDLAQQAMSTAEFDASGNLTGYTADKGLGSLDVQQQEGERMLKGRAEGAGMLRSGQYARDLATSQAGYRASIMGGRAAAAGQKAGVDSELSKSLAEAQAAYSNVGGTSGGGGGATSGNNKQTTPGAPTQPITPVPTFTKPGAPQRTPTGVTSALPSGFKPKTPKPYVPPKKTVTARGGSTKIK